MLQFLNDNAASIQAIGSVLAILAAIGVARWQTHVLRRNRADARHRAARVLAMELLPTVKTIHKDLLRALELGWDDPNHLDIKALQERDICAPDAVEDVLNRLVVLDEDTSRAVLGMLAAIREYRHIQSATNMLEVVRLALGGELERRKSLLDDAQRHAAEAEKRLGAVAMGKL